MGIQNHCRFEIPFIFNGKTVILKVTKFSTCDDVIHMILHKFGQPITKVALYAMYERTLSMERQLSGRSLVYKVWRSWGCERKHFQFLIKCKETKLQFKRSLSSTSSENDIDELFLDHYNKKAQILKEQGKSTADVNHVSFSSEDRKTTENTKTTKGQPSSSKNSESESDNSFSDTDSEDDLSFYDTEPESMNKAFIKSSRDSDSDEGIDVTSVNSIDLDTAFIDNNKCTSALDIIFGRRTRD
ncbi:uncharacterized protein LOC132718528 [Ruditapes philippinarum]|uniref:uncharacterized protein LOC132718528 n=1 Tax=Ruditapes philippinarum TaxID=129788 RepID=UPI00295B8D68|nr:uncharacterized protein LOC132718528 [Ruditapes philippinarum]